MNTELKIDPKFKNLIPPLSHEEFDLLEQSCLAEGIRDAIVTWQGFIIDGHNRYSIAQKHGLEFGSVEKKFDSAEDVICWMVDNQLGRRNLTDFVRYELVAKKKEALIEKGKVNMSLAVTNGHQGLSIMDKPSHNTQTQLAKSLSWSIGKLARAEKVAKKADSEVKELLRQGEVTINQAYQDIKRAEREEKKAIQKAQELEILDKMNKDEDVPVPEYGKWIQLGRHWLYCGNNQDEAFRSKLPQSDFVFADPPYNAGVDDWDSDFVWELDWLIDYAPTVIVTPGIISIPDLFQNTKMPYKWSMACFITNGMTRGALGFGNWIFMPVFSRLKSLHKNSQDVVKVSISPDSTHYHKGRKPIKLIQSLLELFCDKIVIDPFLGSGTTLFASEVMGKTCYAAESNLSYCQKIIASFYATKNENNI